MSSPFNQENQDPDWKKAVIVWNGNHAKRNEHDIFFCKIQWWPNEMQLIKFEISQQLLLQFE